MPFILAKKLKMSQIWKDNKVIPVTVLLADPNKASILRTKEKDGYEAAQLTLGKHKREFRIKSFSGKEDLSPLENLKTGDTVGVSVFKEGDIVRVSGMSKGRGFQGVVK